MAITICDVAPRDGLQNDPTILAPAVRAELVDRLAAAGLPRIEAVSFVNPARVPQMAGAEEVVAAIERVPGVVYAGLALNDRGYDRLRETGLDEVHFAFAASEEFNQRNQGTTVEDSMQSAERIVARAHEDGIRATVTIGTSFGCPFEGAIDPERVLEIAARLVRGRRGRDRLRRHGRRRRPEAGPAPRLRGGRARRAGRRAPPQHALDRLRERVRGDRLRRDRPRRVGRRHRRLPLRAESDRATSRPRTSSTCSTARASRPASTSTR